MPPINRYLSRTRTYYRVLPPIAPVCASRKYWYYSGNRHYSACCHYRLFPSVPRDFTGTIAGNRHYSTGTIEGPLLYWYILSGRLALCQRRVTTHNSVKKTHAVGTSRTGKLYSIFFVPCFSRWQSKSFPRVDAIRVVTQNGKKSYHTMIPFAFNKSEWG